MNENSFLCMFKLTLNNNYNKKKPERIQCIHLAILRTIVSNCIKCFGTFYFSLCSEKKLKSFNDFRIYFHFYLFLLIKSQS